MYEFGPFRVDPLRRLLWREGKAVPLHPKAFEVLLVLVERGGSMVEKDELMRLVWPGTAVEDNNLTRNISTLRKALGEEPDEHRYIVTIPGRGYRFVGKVVEVRPPRPNGGESATGGPGTHPAVRRPASHKWFAPGFVMAVLLVLLGGVAATVLLTHAGRETQPQAQRLVSLAVLPFQSLGPSANDQPLGVGVADSLITRLSNARRLVVRPTASILKYGDSASDPVSAGRKLGVDAVLAGSVQRDGDQVRVRVQLVRVRDGVLFWAKTFDQKWTNIFAVQDSISEEVAAALTLKLNSTERVGLAKHFTNNPAAYESYLRGRFFWGRRTPEGFEKAIKYFQEAAQADPNYALAYAGLADCYNLQSTLYLRPDRETFPKAKAAAMRALQLDDGLAEAHAGLGYARLNADWDWAGAEREYRSAIELEPNYSTAHQWYAWELMLQERNAESLAEMKTAHDLEPLSLAINTSIGLQYYYMHRYGDAIEQFRRVLEMEPDYLPVRRYIVNADKAARSFEAMFRDMEEVVRLDSPSPREKSADRGYLLAWREAYSRRGERSLWLKMRDQATKERRLGNIAGFAALTGDRDGAFENLEKSFAEHEQIMLYLLVEPPFQPLRSDPRFAELARRVGLRP